MKNHQQIILNVFHAEKIERASNNVQDLVLAAKESLLIYRRQLSQ